MLELTLNYALATPIVVGVVEVIKKTGLATRFVPLCSLLVGLLLAMFLQVSLAEGLVLGLSACGLWDVGKKVVLNK